MIKLRKNAHTHVHFHSEKLKDLYSSHPSKPLSQESLVYDSMTNDSEKKNKDTKDDAPWLKVMTRV